MHTIMDKYYAELAEVAFKAYNEAAGGKTWDGKDIPPFAEVGDKVQQNWIAAVSAAAEKVIIDSQTNKE